VTEPEGSFGEDSGATDAVERNAEDEQIHDVADRSCSETDITDTLIPMKSLQHTSPSLGKSYVVPNLLAYDELRPVQDDQRLWPVLL
jgi:hypothetical protein